MRLKILLVEDDEAQAGILARLLEREGAYVDVVYNGLDAVRRINIGIFDVALIDYRIPHVNGLAVAKIIHGFADASTRPRLIALTGSVDEVLAETSDIYGGFDAVVAKPFALETLLAAIRKCCEGAPERIARPVHIAEGLPPPICPVPKGQIAPRVLVVDDDQTVRSLLQTALQTEGYAVDCAANGLEALRLLNSAAYDVALVDYHMPELDGLGTAKLIYDLLDRQHRPRLVALTAAIGDLMVEDPHYGLLFDNVVMKSEGIPTMLSAVRASLNYLRLRANQPPPDLPQTVRVNDMLHRVSELL